MDPYSVANSLRMGVRPDYLEALRARDAHARPLRMAEGLGTAPCPGLIRRVQGVGLFTR